MSNIGNVTFQKMIGGQKFILNQNPDGFVCTFTSVIFSILPTFVLIRNVLVSWLLFKKYLVAVFNELWKQKLINKVDYCLQ